MRGCWLKKPVSSCPLKALLTRVKVCCSRLDLLHISHKPHGHGHGTWRSTWADCWTNVVKHAKSCLRQLHRSNGLVCIFSGVEQHGPATSSSCKDSSWKSKTENPWSIPAASCEYCQPRSNAKTRSGCVASQCSYDLQTSLRSLVQIVWMCFVSFRRRGHPFTWRR